jgi:hypothetical protein
VLLGDVEDDQPALAELLGDVRLEVASSSPREGTPARSTALKANVLTVAALP